LWFTEDGEETGNEIGKAVLGFNPAAKNQAQQATPIRLGTSGSNVKDISIGSTTYCCTGTLGSLVQDASGNTYILSNNHVLARSNAAQIGEQIMQRGYTDTVPKCSTTGTIIVAKLSTFVPLIFGSQNVNVVDAAIAQTLPGQVDPAGSVLGIGTISTATVKARLGMRVEKAGRTTGLTSGSIDTVNFTSFSSYSQYCGGPATQVATFASQFRIVPLTTSREGDSGSLIVKVTPAGQHPNPVGLLYAGDSTGRTVANPIVSVLHQLSSRLGSTVSFVGTAPSLAELAALAADKPDPEVEAVSRVKNHYDDYLFSLPEVVGHGVSYSKTGSGRLVIRLCLRKATDVALRTAPTSLEGVPVETEETGEYRAIQNCATALAAISKN
jgi:hypothetical protein